MPRKHRTLDRVLGRVDNLDPVNLANLVQRLARERGFFEAVFAAIREGVLVVDADGVIEYANDAAARMVALKEPDVGRVSLWRVVPGLRQSLDLAPAEGIPGRSAVSREIELTYPERRIVRLYIVPFQEESDGREEEPRFAVILNDVTREVQSTRERIESERISSILLLAAGVAHEIGNPLNSLTIHLQLMDRHLRKLERTPALEKIGAALEVCRTEVQRLDDIIRHFLDAIRPQPPDLQEIDLLEVLEEVLRVQGQELHDRGLTVDVESDLGGPALVKADRNQVKQVFFNVVKNAMEAMTAGGHLQIRARGDDELVYLQFGDTGRGIDREDLPRLFQPFHTTKPGGHGLGLMIVQRIMRDHGGQVGLDSREGVGTVVTLQFPRKDRRVRLLEK